MTNVILHPRFERVHDNWTGGELCQRRGKTHLQRGLNNGRRQLTKSLLKSDKTFPRRCLWVDRSVPLPLLTLIRLLPTFQRRSIIHERRSSTCHQITLHHMRHHQTGGLEADVRAVV